MIHQISASPSSLAFVGNLGLAGVVEDSEY